MYPFGRFECEIQLKTRKNSDFEKIAIKNELWKQSENTKNDGVEVQWSSVAVNNEKTTQWHMGKKGKRCIK